MLVDWKVVSKVQALIEKAKHKGYADEWAEEVQDMHSIFAVLRDEVLDASIPDNEKVKMLEKVYQLSTAKTNLMIVGATGAGKSSTINAMFNMGRTASEGNEDKQYWEVAPVGVSVDPETMDIDKYVLGNLVLWDTPGLGDGEAADATHTKQIRWLLSETDKEGVPLIDLVLVVLDASAKDLGTAYQLINSILIPALGGEGSRILVALNQADIAMHGGQHWDYEQNRPDEVLQDYLEDKVRSIHDRINESTGLDITPIYYCAGYKEESGEQMLPYNLAKLLYYIILSVRYLHRKGLLSPIP